ncbi:hypothetical protein CVS30_04110 [Arthrobacter psychrolactophilus]|uniref:DUF4350 domain-containing protein n=1 Tax=Arthrobacter psychrolactophilus TaxID=92442 RepID=A0A2V5IV38_9MICC|nr:DUF4350 domain-containing protein [Arthrobacter psychrolactophilus]PYI39851.1 hypothetical protein CVS30_04110 [Arthrobacter psychrolactophilus]
MSSVASHRTSSEPETFRADPASTAQRAGRLWRTGKFWIICAAIFVALSLLAFILAKGGEQSSGTLSITNPAPAGAQGAAEVLRSHGVDVSATDSLADTLAALSANGAGNSTVVFYDPYNFLSPDQAATLADEVREAGARLVALSPAPLTVARFSPDLLSAGTARGTASIAAGCSQPDAVAAGMIDGGSSDLGVLAPVSLPLHLYQGTQNCFTPQGETAGQLAFNAAGDVMALGNPGILINQNLANRGNAALAVRLLGHAPNLLWYTVSIKDLPVAEQAPSLAELTPSWIFPASSWLLLVAVIGMLWKGRRSGPLVPEPLPVIVKASETLAGRARLYQDGRAVGTASRTLRHASLTRLARALRLGITAEPDAVVLATAAATGRPVPQVHALLLGALPKTEQEMLTMAVELTALEEEVAQR